MTTTSSNINIYGGSRVIKQEEIREGIAELEHDQWRCWSQTIANMEELSSERLKRWEKLWVPYDELTEEQKDSDREWADKVLALEAKLGVVRKVDRELPELTDASRCTPGSHTWNKHLAEFNYQQAMLKAGYVAVEEI